MCPYCYNHPPFKDMRKVGNYYVNICGEFYLITVVLTLYYCVFCNFYFSNICDVQLLSLRVWDATSAPTPRVHTVCGSVASRNVKNVSLAFLFWTWRQRRNGEWLATSNCFNILAETCRWNLLQVQPQSQFLWKRSQGRRFWGPMWAVRSLFAGCNLPQGDWEYFTLFVKLWSRTNRL